MSTQTTGVSVGFGLTTDLLLLCLYPVTYLVKSSLVLDQTLLCVESERVRAIEPGNIPVAHLLLIFEQHDFFSHCDPPYIY